MSSRSSARPVSRRRLGAARRRLPVYVTAVVAVALVAGCSATTAAPPGEQGATPDADAIEHTASGDGSTTAAEALRVGAGADGESVLLAHTMVALLEHEGITAEVVSFSEAQDVRQALELGAVDLAPGYTGEAWLETLGRADPPGDPAASFEAVSAHDEAEGLVWLRPQFLDGFDRPPANATFAFVVRGPPSIDADLRTMSQLAARLSEQPDARVCVDREFAARPDGLQAVLAAYSVRSDRPFLAADPAEAIAGVASGHCLAGLTTATDGAPWQAGLHPLADDLRVFPAFVPLPVLRADVLADDPTVRTAVSPMAAQLTTVLLGHWNARMLQGEPADQVAQDAMRELLQRAGRTVTTDDDHT